MWRIMLCLLLFCLAPAARAAPLQCAGTVAPGLAYPDAAGHWKGREIVLCRQIARKLGLHARFTPLFQASDTPPPTLRHSVLFAPQGDIGAGYALGPVIFNDEQAIMVPVWSKARAVADLADTEICVEPGSPEEFNLQAYFKAHHIALHEFPFQETGEMHDAYVAGRCGAITARRSLLAGLRANEAGARQHDRILPADLGDSPVRIATPADAPGWTARIDKIVKENHHEP